ncbi:unnamed protein product [Owenia fusiformis]|uniref:Glucosidase 2 subunit beta n=1 Tax=Owenia fusiformis TaxID=6347 RepID=A0A8S4N1D3_OWEFU|nr:unnamed protein product [Owenia fusiformis]
MLGLLDWQRCRDRVRMKLLRKPSRKYQVVLFIAMAGGLYLTFQVLILQFIDVQKPSWNKKKTVQDFEPPRFDEAGHWNKEYLELKKLKDVINKQRKKEGLEKYREDVWNKDENNIHDQEIINAHHDENIKKTTSTTLKQTQINAKNKLSIDVVKQEGKLLNMSVGYNDGISNQKDRKRNQKDENKIIKSDNSIEVIPRGVLPIMAENYQSSVHLKFRCIHSKDEIPFTHVNDDYCDCEDGSDEPGTSACRNGRFFCKYQVDLRKPIAVSSSVVNDGICDCCDGSDEWSGVVLPKEIQVTDQNAALPVFHAPCQNRCHAVEQQKAKDIQLHKLGARLKQEYIKEGKGENEKIYGPDAVFFKLSHKCFEIKAHEYEYSVCPFRHVKQIKFPSSSKMLGRKTRWITLEKDHYVLGVDDGDHDGCVAWPRHSVITFECGLEDRVVSVQEADRCKYEFKFLTPAAC